MKLRAYISCILLVTVLAPSVLFYYSDFGSDFTYSSKKALVEDDSTIAFSGDLRQRSLLLQEPSSKSNGLRKLVPRESSTKSSSNEQDSSTTYTAGLNRQLTEKVRQGGLGRDTGKHLLDESVIRQVTNKDLDGIQRNNLDNKNSNGSFKIAEEKMNDHALFPGARVLQLKDQLIRARIYLSLPATRTNSQFIRELRLRIKEVQRVLGDASKDSDLPKSAADKLKAMEQTLLKGKQIIDDSAAVVKKLRAMLHSVEEQLRVQRKQALFLTHLTAKTMPKGLHCLPLRLSRDYFDLDEAQRHFPEEKLEDPKLYHYALFSDNVLAAAVVVNSTITHAWDSSKHVFHIVTDRLNYAALRMWFIANPPGKATIQVQNVEEFRWLNSSYSPVLKQLGYNSMTDYYFKNRGADSDPNIKYRNPKYLSVMNYLRFYLPEIFPKLDKILFLDDDVVVQKDLSDLWSIDLKGKVIGVVETCGESFHRFDRYTNFTHPLISKSFSPRACAWAFGLNIVDLSAWRKQNITQIYHRWQILNQDKQLWKIGTLPPGLITFWKQTYSLEKSWHVLGLGYNPHVPQKDIERAAVIHYNGNLKPWLEISIPKFRKHWFTYVDYDQVYLHECNITP